MGTRKRPFNEDGIKGLPDDKPVVYEIQTAGGNPNYIGSAKRGRVKARLGEHLGEILGAKVKIKQFSSISDAQKAEQRAIKSKQPPRNKQGT